MSNITFVTCFYSNSNYNKLDYIISGIRTLKINQPIVIYVGDEEVKNLIYSVRKILGYEDKTKIIVTPLEELPMYKYRDKINENRQLYWATKDARCNTDIHIILMSKFFFVNDTMENNYYNTSHVSWIDYNLLSKKPHNSNNYTDDSVYELINTISQYPKDKFSTLIINYWEKKDFDDLKNFYSSYKYIVAGLFYTTPIDIGKKIIQELITYGNYVTEQGYGHSEEHLIGHMIDLYEDDFDLSIGDYQDAIHNYYSVKVNHPYCNYVLQKYLSHDRYNKLKNKFIQ